MLGIYIYMYSNITYTFQWHFKSSCINYIKKKKTYRLLDFRKFLSLFMNVIISFKGFVYFAHHLVAVFFGCTFSLICTMALCTVQVFRPYAFFMILNNFSANQMMTFSFMLLIYDYEFTRVRSYGVMYIMFGTQCNRKTVCNVMETIVLLLHHKLCVFIFTCPVRNLLLFLWTFVSTPTDQSIYVNAPHTRIHTMSHKIHIE